MEKEAKKIVRDGDEEEEDDEDLDPVQAGFKM